MAKASTIEVSVIDVPIIRAFLVDIVDGIETWADVEPDGVPDYMVEVYNVARVMVERQPYDVAAAEAWVQRMMRRLGR